MVAVMIAATSTRLMGKMTLSLKWKVPGWLATLAMAAAAGALAVVTLQ